MKLRLLASCTGADTSSQLLTSFLVNDRVVIDAGSIGFVGDLAVQEKVHHIFVSHTHIDHLASLPIFLENVYTFDQQCVTLHGSPAVLECLQRDLFNDRLWPDFIELSKNNPPFLRIEELEAGKPTKVEGLSITPIEVDHVIPTQAFIIDDGKAAVVIAGDTGPTQEVWDHANKIPHLRAVFLECSFPDSMEWLAKSAKHLTPVMFAHEKTKVKADIPFHPVHIKAFCRQQVIDELDALGDAQIQVGEPDRDYLF